jgi:hypothetical protein
MVSPVVIGGGQTISPEQRDKITLEPTTPVCRFYRPRLDPCRRVPPGTNGKAPDPAAGPLG